MKFTRLCAASLVAVIGLSTLGSTQAFAADDATELDSTGKVTITEGEVGGGTDTKDPEKPTEPITDGGGEEITTQPNKGPYGIQAVSNLNFGTFSRQSATVEKFSQPVKIYGAEKDALGNPVITDGKLTADMNDERLRGQYVQWADLRDGGNGYQIQAKMTEQFANGSNKLVGATIDYSNGILNYNTAQLGTMPKMGATVFQLTEDPAASAVVVATADAGAGKGEYFAEYGQSAGFVGVDGIENTLDTTGSSVKLTVPAAVAASAPTGDYVAKVTWTMVAQ
ncbi:MULTISPECIES: WxL domain-containing protein [unclassified Enterococcus]|uniref:WxL domain-containing protein n=1 Tax=unclassified Enterococcus TaxID=2608891 RepID=UPI001CE1E915|nr:MULTISPECIES: WxL domain-containing protein [unclassified Enterococcus]MCA5014146.1 WxL domain-containing protein [Enterococcus sp. S23]MCA5017634.1 WxL domain-containing protein [Enterococcus sp. S22(2020)]